MALGSGFQRLKQSLDASGAAEARRGESVAFLRPECSVRHLGP